MHTIEVIAVCYKRYGELKVFVQSMLNQTCSNWKLHLIHDGEDLEFRNICEQYSLNDGRITFSETKIRYNDYGHTLRDLGLKNASGNYVILTNADNYFIPKAIEYICEAASIENPDVVMYDMIHSHKTPGGRQQHDYCFFETNYARGSIDITSAAVKLDLARSAGFRDKTHDGDATYFEDVAKVKGAGLRINKIRRVLVVHN